MNFKTTSTQIGQCLENKFYKGLKSVNTSCPTPVSVSGSGCYSQDMAMVSLKRKGTRVSLVFQVVQQENLKRISR